MKETGYDKPFEVEYATGCFMFFRTEIFKKLNGFDENIFLYLEDADITRRVNQISKTIFYPYNYVIHDWQRGAHNNLKLMWINIKSAVWYFGSGDRRKNRPQHPIPKYLNIPFISGFFEKTFRRSKK